MVSLESVKFERLSLSSQSFRLILSLGNLCILPPLVADLLQPTAAQYPMVEGEVVISQNLRIKFS